MKLFSLLYLLLASCLPCIAQNTVTTDVKLRIDTEVEKESLEFRKSLGTEKEEQVYRSFAMDTFRISRTMDKMMDVDYSTHGMLQAMYTATESWDRLLNKYYVLLKESLKEKDKYVLLNAQRAWLKYREEEEKLIVVLNGDTYTGGGTMHQLTLTSQLMDRVEKRAIELFEFYNGLK